MAIKIKKKRPDSPEELLDEPDQVLAATQETFGWLQENRHLVMAGIGILVLAVVGVSLGLDARGGKLVESSDALVVALNASTAPVTGEDAVYASVAARAADVLLATQSVSETGTVGQTAGLLAASAQLTAGASAEAAAGYAAFADSRPGTADALVAHVGVAVAKADGGDLSGALAELETIRAQSTSLGWPTSLLGAQLVDTYGSSSDALAAYEGLRTEFVGRPELADVEYRIEQLELELGVGGDDDEEAAEAE